MSDRKAGRKPHRRVRGVYAERRIYLRRLCVLCVCGGEILLSYSTEICSKFLTCESLFGDYSLQRIKLRIEC